MTNFNINKQDILLGIIIVLAIFNILNINGVKTDVKGYKKEIEVLQKKVDSAKIVDKQITNKIDSVKNKVVTITKDINKIDNNITIIKKQTNEKINNVDNFSANELEQFFTKRYDKSSN